MIGEDGTLITVEGEPAARPVSAGMRVGSILLGALLALVSIGTAVWVVLVGHAGAVSVWQG